MTLLCERDRSSFRYIAHVCCGDPGGAQRHWVKPRPRQSILQSEIILDVVPGTQNGVRHAELAQCTLNSKFRREVRNVAKLLHFENREIGHVLQPNPLC